MTERLFTRDEAAALLCMGNVMQDVKDKTYYRFYDGRFEAAKELPGQPIWYHAPILYDRNYILIGEKIMRRWGELYQEAEKHPEQPKAGRDE